MVCHASTKTDFIMLQNCLCTRFGVLYRQYKRGEHLVKLDIEKTAFDFDGVVADTFRTFIDIARLKYGLDIDYEHITEYDFMNIIDARREAVEDIIETLTHRPHEVDIRPNKGAAEVLPRISSKTGLLLVTARPYSEPVLLWFKRHFPQIDPAYIKVFATGDSTKKLPVLKEHGIKYFVDDRLDTCYMLEKADIIPVVYNQPWNRDHHPFYCVNDWVDIAYILGI